MVPVEGMHPIALQLGHLINAEHMFKEMVEPGSAPPLPDGLQGGPRHQEAGRRRLPLQDQGRVSQALGRAAAATKALLDRISDADLDDNRGGKLPPWAPTVAAVLNMVGMHALNHSGQFVAVRRKLNKPIAF